MSVVVASAAEHDFEIAATHFRRLWADRHDVDGESALSFRPGDVTDRSKMHRHSLRMCVGMMRRARGRIDAGL